MHWNQVTFRAGSTGQKSNNLALILTPLFFSHPNADDGFTLAHGDKGIREFWIEHGIVCRHIGAAMGRALGSPCVTQRLGAGRLQGHTG